MSIFNTVLQSATLSIISNILAQVIDAYRKNVSTALSPLLTRHKSQSSLRHSSVQMTDHVMLDPSLPQHQPDPSIRNLLHPEHALELLLARLHRIRLPQQCHNRCRSPKQDRRESQSSTKEASLQRQEHPYQVCPGPNPWSCRQYSPLHWDHRHD